MKTRYSIKIIILVAWFLFIACSCSSDDTRHVFLENDHKFHTKTVNIDNCTSDCYYLNFYFPRFNDYYYQKLKIDVNDDDAGYDYIRQFTDNREFVYPYYNDEIVDILNTSQAESVILQFVRKIPFTKIEYSFEMMNHGSPWGYEKVAVGYQEVDLKDLNKMGMRASLFFNDASRDVLQKRKDFFPFRAPDVPVFMSGPMAVVYNSLILLNPINNYEDKFKLTVSEKGQE